MTMRRRSPPWCKRQALSERPCGPFTRKAARKRAEALAATLADTKRREAEQRGGAEALAATLADTKRREAEQRGGAEIQRHLQYSY